MFNHRMVKNFLKEFDESTGKPKYLERVKKWPQIKLNLNQDYENNLKNLLGEGVEKLTDLIPLPGFIQKPAAFLIEFAITNITNLLTRNIMPGIHLVINIILEIVNGNIKFEEFDNDLFHMKIKDRNNYVKNQIKEIGKDNKKK